MPLALSSKSRVFEPSGLNAKLRTRFVHFLVPSSHPSSQWVTTKDSTNPRALRGMQITASENHPGFSSANPMTGDVGGPFHMHRKQSSFSGGSVSIKGSTVSDGVGYLAEYVGPFLACDPEAEYFSWPKVDASSDSTLFALGTKAIAIVKPTNSVADAATALIELYREGLPKMVGATLWKSKTETARRKAAGSEYLNVEFGWKPLIGDIQDVYKAIKKSDAVMKQYQRDAGKVVRRKFEFPSEKWTDRKVLSSSHLPHITMSSSILMKDQGGSLRGRLIQTDIFEKRTWFSGAFTYHLPDDWYKQGSSSKMDVLLGTKITPEVVWNVTPWSWFADWFANTGDVISNLTDMASDGLVLRYGYIMQHVKHERVYSFEGDHPYSTDAVPSPITLVDETKVRLAASPYGFGITWEGFSARQAAILAALGLTKGGKGK